MKYTTTKKNQRVHTGGPPNYLLDNGSGNVMQNTDYTFDNASNVTSIINNTGVVNTLGGAYETTYKYDVLHRLVESYGGGDIGNYNTYLKYSPSGRLIGKYRDNSSAALSATADMAYGYCDEYQPHTVRRMFDYKNDMLYDMRWDDGGNLGQVSMAKPGDMVEAGRFLFWTEDNHLHTVVDDKYYSYYTYDHGGERRLKLTGKNDLLDINADFMSTYTLLNEPTLYPSAYMVLTNKGYTKHYYAGTERVAARIGGGGLNALCPVVAKNEELQITADMLFDQSLEHVNNRVLNENNIDCIMQNEFAKEEFGYGIDGIPYQTKTAVEFKYDQFVDIEDSIWDGHEHNDLTSETEGSIWNNHHHGHEEEVYFYHSDHLGSANWITEKDGHAVQHLQYLPYGERYIDQRMSGYNERFTFTGKERDEETGFGYFGARYMDHELMTMWLSVDPMSDKYLGISPYAYCAWNPVKLVDPNGREIGDYYSVTGRYLGWDGVLDDKVHIIDDKVSLAKDGNGNVDASKVTQLVSTTYETLEATMSVFERTKKNGGSIEESTAVLAGLISILGEQGYTGSDGKPHCNFPSLTDGEQGLGVTSIHSHPFTQVGEDGYHTVTPSADDMDFFSKCDLNIIVGNITAPGTHSIYPNSTDNIGAAFITPAGKTITTMSIRSIERVINNRHKATDKHWKQIKKGL